MTDTPGWTPPTEPGAGPPPGWGPPPQAPPPGWGPPPQAPPPGWGPPPQGPPPQAPPPPGPPPPGQPPPPGWGTPPGAPPGWGTPPGAPPGWGTPPGAPPGAPPGWGEQAGYGGGYGPGYGAPQWGQPGYVAWGMAAPKPGIVPLRPLGLGEILDGAFGVVREHPKVTIGLSAIVVSITQLLSFAVAAWGSLARQGYGESDVFNGGATALNLLTTILGAIGLMILAGMLTSVMGDAVLGRPTSIGETWARVRPRFWPLLGAGIVGGLVPFLGLVACIIPGVFLWGAWSFMTPAVVLERVGVGQSIRRSYRLAVPDWWRVFGIRALAWIIAAFIRSVVTVPATLLALGSLIASDGDPGSLGIVPLAVITLGAIIAGTITAPFTAGVDALLYIDRRIRAEGLDVTLAQAAAAEAQGQQPGMA